MLCDRCKRETAEELEVPIPRRPEEIDLAALPFVVVAEYMHVPSVGGVYFAMVGDVVCYVGQSGNMGQRWLHHHVLPRLSAQRSGAIAWLTIADTDWRKQFERESIKHFRPLWNRDPNAFDFRLIYPSQREIKARRRCEHYGQTTHADQRRLNYLRLGAMLRPR